MKKRSFWRDNGLSLDKHSLSGAFFALFLLSFIGHAIGGAHAYSDELRQFGQAPVSTWQWKRALLV